MMEFRIRALEMAIDVAPPTATTEDILLAAEAFYQFLVKN